MKSIVSVLSLALCLGLGSCTSEAKMPSADAIMQQAADAFGQVVTKLETVKDDATAETAKKDVEPLVAKLESLGSSLKGLGATANLAEMKNRFEATFTPLKERLNKLTATANEKIKPLIQRANAAISSFMS